MEHVTGDRAREMLSEFGDPNGSMPPLGLRDCVETLAWLYGRVPEEAPDLHVVPIRGDDADVVYALHDGGIVFDVDGGHRTIEEAEEFARAILATVEEARRRV